MIPNGSGFNAVITGISAASALFISVITLSGFLNEAFELEDPLTSWLGGIDLGDAGLILVGLFVVAGAVTAWRPRQGSNPAGISKISNRL